MSSPYAPTATASASALAAEHRVELHTLSHCARVEKKTNLVRAIEAAMDEALGQEATLNFPLAAHQHRL